MAEALDVLFSIICGVFIGYSVRHCQDKLVAPWRARRPPKLLWEMEHETGGRIALYDGPMPNYPEAEPASIDQGGDLERPQACPLGHSTVQIRLSNGKWVCPDCEPAAPGYHLSSRPFQPRTVFDPEGPQR